MTPVVLEPNHERDARRAQADAATKRFMEDWLERQYPSATWEVTFEPRDPTLCVRCGQVDVGRGVWTMRYDHDHKAASYHCPSCDIAVFGIGWRAGTSHDPTRIG